jgi:hypothetical protein
MGYVRKILLFVISVAMVVVGLLMIAFGLFWHGARVGLFVAGGDGGIPRTVSIVGGFHCAADHPALTGTRCQNDPAR